MNPGCISVHVLSDSLGETGEMVARAAIAQFPPGSFVIERLPRVDNAEGLRRMVREHCGHHCLFLYTLVDAGLREEMQALCDEGANGVDLLWPSVSVLASVTGVTPAGQAGSMRRTDEEYFERIEAMEFAVKHDDGRNPQGLTEADIVLIGVSRTSKTPLSMYLAVKGYRVANVPLAHGITPPDELFSVDPRRIFGLVTSSKVLMEIRSARMRELGGWVPHYAEREDIEHELDEARALMRKLGCIVVHTDDRAIEEAAQEIIRHVVRQQPSED